MAYQFFNDVSDETAFYVLKLKGNQQRHKLRMTAFCYHNNEYAKQWRDKLIAKLDRNKPYYAEVVAEIDDIYLRMID